MRTRRWAATAGQAAIEFALALPVLLILSVGLIDGALMVWQSNTLSQATREGARYAIVHGTLCDSVNLCNPAWPLGQAPRTNQDIENRVRSAAVGISSLTPVVTYLNDDGTPCTSSQDPCANPGRQVRVTATVTYVPLAAKFFAGGRFSFPLRGSTTMIIQQ